MNATRNYREVPSAESDTKRAAVFFGLLCSGAGALVLLFVGVWFLVGDDAIMLAGLALAGLMVLVGVLRMDQILGRWASAAVRQMEADAADQRRDNSAARQVAILDAKARQAEAEARANQMRANLEQTRITAYTRRIVADGAELPARPDGNAPALADPSPAASQAIARYAERQALPLEQRPAIKLPNDYMLSVAAFHAIASRWPASRRQMRKDGARFLNYDFTAARAILDGAQTEHEIAARVSAALRGDWGALPHAAALPPFVALPEPTDREDGTGQA